MINKTLTFHLAPSRFKSKKTERKIGPNSSPLFGGSDLSQPRVQPSQDLSLLATSLHDTPRHHGYPTVVTPRRHHRRGGGRVQETLLNRSKSSVELNSPRWHQLRAGLRLRGILIARVDLLAAEITRASHRGFDRMLPLLV